MPQMSYETKKRYIQKRFLKLIPYREHMNQHLRQLQIKSHPMTSIMTIVSSKSSGFS